ncbi:MDR family MFS transporter [Pigmentiphaga soli]|uniref:MDR family MFS transporter n=1 Tax=Pigmentiphaga soli TaxID=1007095 RepID=A0ABP8HLZ8_9BURK
MSSSPSAPESGPPAVTRAQFRSAISAALTAMMLGALDQTIVSVSVPTIAKQLGGFEWMAWVISAYLIASTATTPIYGKFSDLFGRRAVMLTAIGIFTAASVACALAQTMPQLVLARVVQGIGGGGLIAMAQSMIADVVPMRERGRFQVYVSSVWAGASVAGPVVGGMLTQYLSWPWIFWINLPVAALAITMVRRSAVGSARKLRKIRIDWLGIAVLLAGLIALLIPITRIGQGVPVHESANLAGLGFAVVALTYFARHELRVDEPIIPLSMLGEPIVVLGCTVLFVCFFIFVSMSVLVPLRMQLVTGAGPGDAALAMLPYTLSNPVSGFVCGRWIYHYGRVRPLQRLGAALMVASMAALALISPSHGLATGIVLTVLGVGLGCQLPTTLMMLQNSVSHSMLGTVTAVSAFFRLLGGAVGIAMLSAIVLALLRDVLPADAAAHGLEGLGGLLGQAGQAGISPDSVDRAFRYMLLGCAVLSLLNVFCVNRLPDVQLGARPRHAAIEAE